MIRVVSKFTSFVLPLYTVLHFAAPVQAQIQSLEVSGAPSIIQSTPAPQSKLYVERADDKKSKANAEESPQPAIDIAGQDIDEATFHEMQRVYEAYKLIAAQQNETAKARALQNEPSAPKKPDLRMSTNHMPAKAETGGIGGILQRYQEQKSSRSQTNTLTLTNPGHIAPRSKQNP
ncbi:MAG: hypothetical protein ACK4VI_08035 [Alphaproteobacteria bacterium]